MLTKNQLLDILKNLTIALSLTGTVTLAWDANTESDLAGYKIHYGIASGSYSTTIDVEKVTQYTVPDLIPGTTYYFAATAYDNDQNESAYSIELVHTQKDIDETIKMEGIRKEGG
jgi:fibronectin type 3 domain-containing protein